MIYRLYNPTTDKDKCKALCDKHKVAFKESTIALVAESPTGDIIAYANIQLSVLIEPLVSDNKMSTIKMLQSGSRYIKSAFPDHKFICYTQNIKLINIITKIFGFRHIKNTNVLEEQ